MTKPWGSSATNENDFGGGRIGVPVSHLRVAGNSQGRCDACCEQMNVRHSHRCAPVALYLAATVQSEKRTAHVRGCSALRRDPLMTPKTAKDTGVRRLRPTARVALGRFHAQKMISRRCGCQRAKPTRPGQPLGSQSGRVHWSAPDERHRGPPARRALLFPNATTNLFVRSTSAACRAARGSTPRA